MRISKPKQQKNNQLQRLIDLNDHRLKLPKSTQKAPIVTFSGMYRVNKEIDSVKKSFQIDRNYSFKAEDKANSSVVSNIDEYNKDGNKDKDKDKSNNIIKDKDKDLLQKNNQFINDFIYGNDMRISSNYFGTLKSSKSMPSIIPKKAMGDSRNIKNDNSNIEKMPNIYDIVEVTADNLNDREAVENLEKWDTEFKMQYKGKSYEKEDDLNLIQGKLDSAEANKFPFINQSILNLIITDEETNEKVKGMIRNSNPNYNYDSKKNAPIKSLDSIMNELNQKILNDILFQRISNQLSKNPNGKIEIDKQTQNITNDTISNFKNLQRTTFTNPMILQFNDIYNRLSIDKNTPPKLFDFSEEKKKIEDMKNNTRYLEEILKEKYEKCIKEAYEKEEYQAQLRMSLHTTGDKIREYKSKINEIKKTYQDLEDKLIQQRDSTKVIQQTNKKKSLSKKGENSMSNIEEFMELQKIRNEKNDQERQQKLMISKLEDECIKITEKINELEQEIKDLKFKKTQIRLELKHLYIQMLKNEEQIIKNEINFTGIIKGLWKINEEVVEDMFPKFLDSESLQFLIENAKLEFELEQLNLLKKQKQNEIRNNSVNLIKVNRAKSTDNFKDDLTDIKAKLQNLKKGIVKIKKPIFMRDGGKSHIIRWEDVFYSIAIQKKNVEEEQEDVRLNTKENEGQQIEEAIDNLIKEVKNQIEKRKRKEIDRIISIFLIKDVDEKTLTQLTKLLISLFGRILAEKEYMQFIRLKQNHDIKISQNKTFIFSAMKNFDNKVATRKQSSFGLMMSYANNFRSLGSKYNQGNYGTFYNPTSGSQSYRENNAQKSQEIVNLEHDFEDSANVNPDYNLIYNYAPQLQNTSHQSTFYKPRAVSSQSNIKTGILRRRLNEKKEVKLTNQRD